MKYIVVTENNHNEVWAMGLYSKEKAQKMIDKGYYHRYMYKADKNKNLIVIEEGK